MTACIRRQREPPGRGSARRICQGAAGVRPRRIRRDMSMATDRSRGRVILHLHQGAAERAIIRAAAELAQMLGVTLQGVFLEDEALPELAALPFIREFRLGTGAWHKLDRRQIAEEQRAAAAEARRVARRGRGALWGSRSCSRSSAATRRCSSPPRRRPATSSWWRSRACRRNVWSMPRRDGWRRRMPAPPRCCWCRGRWRGGRARWRRWCAPNRIPRSASRRALPSRRARRCCC